MRDDVSRHFVSAQEVSASNILKLMNDSVSRLSEAMFDELASSIVESMVVANASVASYLMKIHYILEDESNSSDLNVLARRLETTTPMNHRLPIPWIVHFIQNQRFLSLIFRQIWWTSFPHYVTW